MPDHGLAPVTLHFQKRVSIFPGVRLNFSGSGVSATIGVPGANVNLGLRGPSLNLGIPGSGIGVNIPLRSHEPAPPRHLGPALARQLPSPRVQPQTAVAKSIQSAAIEILTTPDLAELRTLILTARREREAADSNLRDAVQALEQAEGVAQSTRQEREQNEQRVVRLEASWFRAFRKGTIAAARQAVIQALARENEAIARGGNAARRRAEAKDHLDSLFVETEFALSGTAEAVWNIVSEAFERLMASHKVWDVTAARDKQRGQERSTATRVINREEAKLSVAALPVIHAQHGALRWHNKNGHDLYIYPGFLLVYSSDERFAMLDLANVELKFRGVQFQEAETPSADAKRVGTAYTYSNKDGSPDRRYAHNPEIPILLYAEIHFVSESGLSEAFMFSAAEAAASFVDALNTFRAAAW